MISMCFCSSLITNCACALTGERDEKRRMCVRQTQLGCGGADDDSSTRVQLISFVRERKKMRGAAYLC